MYMSLLHHRMRKLNSGKIKRGRTSLDEARPGCLLEDTDEGICTKVCDLAYSDRRIRLEEIAKAVAISHGSISSIVHDHRSMQKLTACWVPKSLSDNQMATKASVCSALLKAG